MASILKVDTITGVATAGSIAITGEGNSTTTNLQQGLIKAWGSRDGNATPGLEDSLNVASLTDVGSGNTTFNLTNAMSNVNGAIASANNITSNDRGMLGIINATSSFRLLTRAHDGTDTDRDCSGMITGDLA